MSIIATALKHLIAAGVSGDDLVRAVAEMEAAMIPAAPDRSKGAIRTERWRRHKASQSVTCDESDDCDAPSLSPNEYISNPLSADPSEANASSVATADDCRVIVDLWNGMASAHDLATVAKLTDKRRKALRVRLKQDGLEAIRAAIERVPKSPFLLGQTGNWIGRGANFEFILKPDTVTKINEGRYDGKLQSGISGLQRPDPLRDALAAAYAEEECERAAGGQADYSGAFPSLPAH